MSLLFLLPRLLESGLHRGCHTPIPACVSLELTPWKHSLQGRVYGVLIESFHIQAELLIFFQRVQYCDSISAGWVVINST